MVSVFNSPESSQPMINGSKFPTPPVPTLSSFFNIPNTPPPLPPEDPKKNETIDTTSEGYLEYEELM